MATTAALPETGFVRLSTVLAVYPISKSAWYAGIAAGKLPAPVKLSERTSAYRVEDIRALIASYDKAANSEAAQ